MSEDAKSQRRNGVADNKSPPATSGRRVVVKSADMNDDLQKEAVDVAIAAFEKHGVEKDVAEAIKKEFDNKYGCTWHCIVGRNFDFNNEKFRSPHLGRKYCGPRQTQRYLLVSHQQGSYVTHETNHFIYFYLDQKAILLFKSG